MKTLTVPLRNTFTVFCIALLYCLPSCTGKNDPAAGNPASLPHLFPEIVRTLPHDPDRFTQGLCFEDNRLYQSAGLYQKSTLSILDTAGALLKIIAMPPAVFAEGCALLSGSLYQITWQEKVCFVYSLPDLICTDTIAYSGEGWGLTENDTLFIMSNGSDTLFFRNKAFATVKKVQVTCEGKPLEHLNELEYARNRVFANVWFSDFIFQINPENGDVERIFDCSELVARENPDSREQVLNGIACDPRSGLFYLTGKNWKNIFVVELPEG